MLFLATIFFTAEGRLFMAIKMHYIKMWGQWTVDGYMENKNEIENNYAHTYL